MIEPLKQIPKELWRKGVSRSDDSHCLWLAVTEINKVVLGLDNLGEWLLGSYDERVRFIKMNSSKVFPALPLLECKLGDVVNGVSHGLSSKGIVEELVNPFPINLVVECGLRHPSEYWQLAALDWAEDVKDLDSLSDLLKEVAVNGASQANQHKAKTLLKSRNIWDWLEMKEFRSK